MTLYWFSINVLNKVCTYHLKKQQVIASVIGVAQSIILVQNLFHLFHEDNFIKTLRVEMAENI